MAHPLHEFLLRWLDTEQYAFDAGNCEHWPPGARPDQRQEVDNDAGPSRQPRELAPGNPA